MTTTGGESDRAPDVYSLYACGGELDPESPIARRAAQIGHACQFAMNIPELAGGPMGTLVHRLAALAALGQMKVYLSPYGRCIGFATWAFLAPDVEAALTEGQWPSLHEWQYNEGTSAWIVDLAVASGSLPYVVDDLSQRVFRDHAIVHYVRRKGALRHVRAWTRAHNGRLGVVRTIAGRGVS